jgi:hypothetical protein
VIWLIVYTVLLPVHILEVYTTEVGSQVTFVAYILFIISSYTSSIVAVVCISITKRRKFLEIIEKISEVDNKVRYTHQEETYMNRKVMFNVISEIILLSVIKCTVTTYYIYEFITEGYYTILVITGFAATYMCNMIFLSQYLNLVYIMKLRYSHLSKRLNNWISGTFRRPIFFNKDNESCVHSNMTVDHGNITTLCVSRFGNFEGTLKQTDICLLRQIYSDLYDITCLINDTYAIPILASICWIVTTILCCLYTMFKFNWWGVTYIEYTIMCSAMMFKVTLFCHTATNEARSSRILVQKLLLEGNCTNECVEELKMFSLQLQVMKNEYTACGFFSLNLRLFTTVVSLIVSYIVIFVQIK